MKITEKLYSNTFFVAICAILCCALWGSATPFIKIGYELILPHKDVSSTILFAGVRFFFAGLITILIYSISRRKILYPQISNCFNVFKLSLFQTIGQYIFFYIGLANTSGVKGTIISGSNAFFAILVSSLVFSQEKLSAKKIFACIIGFAGIVVVNLKGIDLNMNFLGDGFVLFSSISAAVSSTLIKKYSQTEDTVVLSGYQFMLGGLILAITGCIMGGKIYLNSGAAVGVLVYLAFLSAVAYTLWGILLKYNPVSKVTIYSFMIPVFGVILSKLMLPESADVSVINLIITMVLVCTGIIMLNYNKSKK